jgi:hypothetical protein
MLTLTGPVPFADAPVTTTFESAEKIIELGADPIPAAAMISGSADIGGRLVSSFLRDVSLNIDGDADSRTHSGIIDKVIETIDPAYQAYIEQLRIAAAEYLSRLDQLPDINDEREKNGLPLLTVITPDQIAIDGERDPNPNAVETIEAPVLTIVVCTYFHATGAAAEEIRWPWCHRATIVPGPNPLSYWGSGGSAVDRLVKGFDLDLLKSHVGAGITPDSDNAQKVLDYASAFERAYVMPTAVDSMPLQDAVEFTEYLGKVACGYDRFKLGPAGVGGPLDVLVLRREKRTWVSRKRIPERLATR